MANFNSFYLKSPVNLWLSHLVLSGIEGLFVHTMVGPSTSTIRSQPQYVFISGAIHFLWLVRGFAKKTKFKKCEIIMEVGRWVQLSEFVCVWKIVPK